MRAHRIGAPRAAVGLAEEAAQAELDEQLTPNPAYDPAAATARFRSLPVDVVVRQIELIGPLLLFLGRVFIDVQRGQEEQQRPTRARELRELISNLGPAIIKAGQALSSRERLHLERRPTDLESGCLHQPQ